MKRIILQLIKDPTSYQGTFAKFTGQILQIMQSGNTGVMRLSVTNLGYGEWSPTDVVFVAYNKATSAVEGDNVTVYGMLNGTYTYTSQANYQITLPELVACGVGSIPSNAATNAPAHTSSGPTQPSVSAAASAPTPAPAPATTPGSWHTAFTYIGKSSISTQSFALKGSKWRITYTGAGIAVVLLGFMAVPAFAAGSSDSQASCSGATHGAFADVNGNFGFLGQVGGTPGYHNGAVGQEPGATGYNNSHVDCGPQN